MPTYKTCDQGHLIGGTKSEKTTIQIFFKKSTVKG